MKDFNSDSSIIRVIKNSKFIAVRFTIYSLSSVIFIPFILGKFGPQTYGLIALAGFLTQYIGLISNCISSSISRFFSIALNENNWKEANEIFNTAIIANIIIIALQTPIFFIAILKLDIIFDFPPEISHDFRILVICNILIFFFNIMTGVFFTPLKAANRLDLISSLDIANQLLRIVFIFILISIIGPNLLIIAFTDLTLAVTVFFSSILFYKKTVSNNLEFNFHDISLKWAKPILKMSFWLLISLLGFNFFVKTDIWLVNKFVDPEIAGIYAVLLIVPNFVRQIGQQLSNLIAPLYIIDFAKKNTERMINICIFSHKFIGILGALLAGLIIALSDKIIFYWLGVQYLKYSGLLQLLGACLIFTLGEYVIWSIFPALNKTHFSGICNIVTGLINFILSLLAVFSGFGYLGVATATILSTLIKSSILLPYGVVKYLNISFFLFVTNHLISFFVFLISFFTFKAIELLIIYKKNTLSLTCGVLLLILLCFSIFQLFSTREKKILIDLLPLSIKNKLKNIELL